MELTDKIRGLELIKNHIAKHYDPQYEFMEIALSEVIYDLKEMKNDNHKNDNEYSCCKT